ncbi:MAG: nucleotidyltransferase domain-containing protein [Candidatus Margulisiibacteriota bacterium]|jgi:predicted nucleotidyltransferase
MNDKQKMKIFQKIKDILVAKINPNSIFIFGLFATNTETENSDIDILIEKETIEPFHRRSIGVRRLLKDIDFPFDLLIYSPEEIKQKRTSKYSVVYQALTKGIKIYEK